MKKIIAFLFLLVFLTGLQLRAQCNQPFMLTASRTDYLDTTGAITRSVTEQSVIRVTGNRISIQPGDQSSMTGTIKTINCRWSQAFKLGKAKYEAVIATKKDEKKAVLITVEGKGKTPVSCTLTLKDEPGKIIRLFADRFELLTE